MAAVQDTDISPGEFSRRVMILKRFRGLLQDQRDRFRAYLEVLDKQKDLIETGDPEDLIAHVEFEEQIVADIFAIQKVIDPLETMYQAVKVNAMPAGDDIPTLKSALEGLKEEAIVRSARNKELLSKRMLELRSEIQALRSSPYASRRPVFSETGAVVDIRG
jgi:hypothetical protein